MRQAIRMLGVSALLAAMLAAPRVSAAEGPKVDETQLKVGDKAPLFDAKDEQGKRHRLIDHQGKDWVILSFYVLDNTGG